MSGLTRFALLLALGLWIGTIASVSFLVAPIAFAILGSAQAGDVVGAIFPAYYRMGMVVSAITVVAALLLRVSAARPRVFTWTAVLAAVGLLATTWAGVVIFPAARARRIVVTAERRTPASDVEFQRLHRTAVALNAVALVAALGALGAATRGLRT